MKIRAKKHSLETYIRVAVKAGLDVHVDHTKQIATISGNEDTIRKMRFDLFAKRGFIDIVE